MEQNLKWMKAELEKHYEIKTQVLGPGPEDLQQVRVLNRVLTWTKEGIHYEADPRHAEIVAEQLGLRDAKGVVRGVITKIGKRCGFAAFYVLNCRFNPKTPARMLQYLTSVTNPVPIKDARSIPKSIENWEAMRKASG